MGDLALDLKHPLNVQVELTENCNHSCFYCYNHWRTDNFSKNKMSLEESNLILKKLEKEVKPFHVVLTGGEPFMNLPVLLNFMDGLNESDIDYNINSNLTLMNEKTAKILKEINKNLGILTSLPSFKENLFEKITGKKNIKKFYSGLEISLKNNFKITPNMVLHKINHKDVYEQGVFLLENFGLKNFAATPMLRPAGREGFGYLNNKEMISSLEELIRLRDEKGMKVSVLEAFPRCFLPENLRDEEIFERSCSAGRTSLAIGYNGNVRVCTHSPLKEGNLISGNFVEIWESLNPYRENEHVPGECSECFDFNLCHGGCRFEGYNEGDSIDFPDSRMNEPLKPYERRKLSELEENTKYSISDFKVREEVEGKYSVYNGKTLFANGQMVSFLNLLKEKGYFKLNEFPEENGFKEKAKFFGKVLLEKRFLYKQ